MQTMIVNARGYDWATWFMGIMRSFIAGGAGAVASPLGPMILDPKDYNLGSGLVKVLISMLIGFGVSGVVGLAMFLKTHSGPDRIQESLAVAADATAQAGAAIADAQKKAGEPQP